MSQWTKEMVDAHNARVLRGKLAIGEPKPEVLAELVKPKPIKRIRQSSKPLMNKLETRFYNRLLSQYPKESIHIQAVKLKLANGLYYTPDFFVFEQFEVFEVKGTWVDGDSIPKLKMAAKNYPMLKLRLVWESSGIWQEQTILP